MDVETGAILALQILALCSIAAALLAYLMRQSRNATDEYELRNKCHVLVTNCDTCVGLQIALALSEAGYKVFAGLPNPSENSPSMKILKAVEQEREKEMDNGDSNHDKVQVRVRGQIVPLELDPTREDSLRASLDAVRAKLPAGEDGLWAVIHTGGLALPGSIEKQTSSAWESMLRHNLVAPLRTARVFIPLLRVKRGRIVLLGDSETSYASKAGTGLVAFTASRKAVEGAAAALKSELHSSGVDVVLLKPPPINPLVLYASPLLKTLDVESGVTSSEGTWVAPLSNYSVQNSLIPALTTPCPLSSYDMSLKTKLFWRQK
ncbi:PREDICTED: D-beta-hydroxybutyrate dehydrogenase, mitochondrial [Polistes dominula]|uniref:D-beta-hydroxybutyrate dehydrogenase, mitochondrial n=1 Tax=Polistes dominula TaxID=743375 RepID=A0ABM1I0X6_POLDO|nr:PREDICTED: D-beta-hydroxybutyrate dehydrogenase, mitochondrial [Polistes dominula]XP_015173864.1 PREDICTED: D-beta-hydroxybutyrate dehydrogenase, mitochondrial [Polistes dominula]XP_015173865.1 PREDICTED: D-beta-hydroxybutyrate dehydrogenase, mitochondrial [Polistes dominula]